MGGKASKYNKEALAAVKKQNKQLREHIRKLEKIVDEAIPIVGNIESVMHDTKKQKREFNCRNLLELRSMASEEGAVGLKNVVEIAQPDYYCIKVVGCNGDPVWPDDSSSSETSSLSSDE